MPVGDSSDQLERAKRMFAKMGITYDTDDDYLEAFHNLIGYFDILIQMDLRQKAAANAKEENTEKTLD